MTSLLAAPLAPLLDRLFAEDAATDWAAIDLPDAELDRLRASRTAYRDLYTRLAHAPLAVSRETGRLLYMLAVATGAHLIVEFGTSLGLSTLHLAAALRDGAREGGGGRLITTEFEARKAARARAHFAEAGLADLIELREGDALQTLADLPGPVDLVLLDGAKALYPDVLALLEPALRPGALIVADDADASPAYLARVRAPSSGYHSVTVADDVELSCYVAARTIPIPAG